MKFLAIVIVVIIVDRCMPLSVWGWTAWDYKIDLTEFYRRYRLFAFPRTFLGVCVCLSVGIHWVVPISEDTEGLITIAFMVLFGISGAVDVFKIKKD